MKDRFTALELGMAPAWFLDEVAALPAHADAAAIVADGLAFWEDDAYGLGDGADAPPGDPAVLRPP